MNSISNSQLPFSEQLNIRFRDMDAQGHLYFANYMVYADEVLGAYMEELGMAALNPQDMSYLIFTVNIHCDYHSEISGNGQVKVCVGYSRLGKSSADARFELYNSSNGERLASGGLTQVFVDQETRKSTPIPAFFDKAFSSGNLSWWQQTNSKPWSAGYDTSKESQNMSVDQAYNFREVNPLTSTAGVLNPEQLRALGAEGYQSVINLLPGDSEYAVTDEASIVKGQAIDYTAIAVDFAAPTQADYVAFCEAMEAAKGTRIMIHCAANFRASAFYAVYACENLGWTPAQAHDFIDSIWKPDEHPGLERICQQKTWPARPIGELGRHSVRKLYTYPYDDKARKTIYLFFIGFIRQGMFLHLFLPQTNKT